MELTTTPLIFKQLQSDQLLVRLIDDDASASDVRGIINPYGRHADAPRRGVVLESGDGYVLPNGELAPMCAVVGDTIILQFGAGTPVRLNGELLHIVLDRDIFGVTL